MNRKPRTRGGSPVKSYIARLERRLHDAEHQRDTLASAITAHRTLWRNTGTDASPPRRSYKQVADALRDADRKLYERLDQVEAAREARGRVAA